MSLTYQPFAVDPKIEELTQDFSMNMRDTERIGSAVAGAGMIAAGLFARGGTRWALIATGAGLMGRGWSGHCPWYGYMQLDKRHDASGVPGNRGTKVEQSIEVNCAPEILYAFWRDLEQLPRVMRHVESVQCTSTKRSHWKVKAPIGHTVGWDAEIINDEPGKLIAWQSLPGATVRNAGSVWFEKMESGVTRVKVAFEYDPPTGPLGTVIAGLLGSCPEKELAEDLASFKEFAEAELAVPPPMAAAR